MRRIAALLAPLVLAAVALTGCGSSGGSGSSSPGTVTVTGKFGSAPKVTIPPGKAGSALHVQTLIHGSGPVLTAKDAFVGNYVAYIWSASGAHHMASSTFTSEPTLFAGSLLPGIEDAVKDGQVGSRVLAVIPPKYGYGSQGYAQNGVKGTDTLVFVIDIVHIFAGNASASGTNVTSGGHGLPTVSLATSGTAPTVTIPKTKPSSKLVVKTLIKGSGAQVAPGQALVVQYTGLIWRTGKVFDSSWGRGYPFGFTIGASPSQVITGWDTGLLHQTVGSRVLLVIPPKDGYGSAGSSQAGIKGTDTLVFVVDILGAFNGAS
jgi:FKBP-type peptidyl-prolyl cis-trans isomerase